MAEDGGTASRRDINVALIDFALDCRSSSDYVQCFDLAAKHYHPSLFSELDYYTYQVAPVESIEPLERLAADLFLFLLPLRSEGGWADSEWHSASEFFSVAPDTDSCEAFPLSDQIPLIPVARDGLPEAHAALSVTAQCATNAVEFENLLLQFMASGQTRLQTVRALSRYRLATGERWPNLMTQDAEVARSYLDRIDRHFGSIDSNLRSWSSSAREALDRLASSPLETSVMDYRVTGSGPCQRCAMHFASWAAPLMNSGCVEFGTSQREGGLLEWPAALSRRSCRFCGLRRYTNAPSVFHDLRYNKVTFLVPGFQYDQPISSASQDIMEGLVNQYTARSPRSVVDSFHTSTQLVAGSWVEFVETVWRGETVPEDHMFNLVDTEEGGIIVDATKGFIWNLDVDEMDELYPGSRDKE